MPVGEARALGETVSIAASHLAELYEEHVGRATALAALLTGDGHMAEDIAHDAFLRAAGRFRHLREPQAFGAYLRRTVVNACRARARRARLERMFLERAPRVRMIDPDTTVDDRDELLPLIKALPYRQRAALVLRYWDDMPEAHRRHLADLAASGECLAVQGDGDTPKCDGKERTMNDLERRIVEVLSRDAPTFVRTMPRGTVGKVRVLQTFTSFVTLVLFAGFAFGVFSLLSAVPRASHEPGARQTVAPPEGELPSPEGTAEGITDSTAAPPPSATAGEDTMATSVSSLYPYTDQVEGQELYLKTQKHVVGHGHVSGIEWSLAAYDTQLYTGNLFSQHLGGPCGDLFVGDMGDYGGIEFCLHTEETRPNAQFALGGFGNNSDPFAGPITGYAGLVGTQVSTVELRLADGTTSELTLFDAPPGIDARYFATFLDEGTVGTIVAIGSGGKELDGERLCVGDVPRAPDNIGCGHGLLGGPFSVVTSGP